MKTFKTITIGGTTTKKLLKKIPNISNWAKDISSKVTCQKKKEIVELVIATGVDFGLSGYITREKIYQSAKENGLDVCSAEVGLQLAANYKDQPKGEWLLIAMEPITVSGGGLVVFLVLRCDGGELWLYGDGGRPGRVWDADRRWVFLRRKSVLKTLESQSSSDPLSFESRIKTLETNVAAIQKWIAGYGN